MKPELRWFPSWIWPFTLMLVMTGCGLKSDPLPPKVIPPAAVTDLGAASSRAGVLLTWSIADPLDKIGAFQVLRSETVRGEDACPECPQDYRRYRTIPAKDPLLQREGERKLSYNDGDVDRGHFYSYRIVICDRLGICGAASNPAGLIHTGR